MRKKPRIESIEIKDVVIAYNLSPNEVMDMFFHYKHPDPNKSIPICCLYGDQKLESLSDEELEKMGLKRI